jgi:hypothetical protein
VRLSWKNAVFIVMKIGPIPENLLELLLLPLGVFPTPLVDTFQAVVKARAIMVGVKLGIFEVLRDGAQTADSVAAKIHTDPRATDKLLRSLVGIGYLRFKSGRFELARVARRWLLKDSATSLHDNLLHRYLEWEAIESLEDFVRTGAHLQVHERLRPEQWESYQRGMRSLASISAPEVSRRLRVPANARTLLDVGGAHGYYSVATCRRHAQLKATILDLPMAVQASTPLLEKERMGSRIVHRIGDVLTTDLGTNAWDMILVSQLVHHFDEPTNVRLMQRLAESLRPRGTISVLELLRPNSPNSAGQTGAVLDLFFAITSLSGCWSLAQIVSWQRQAQLVPQKTTRLLSIPGAVIQTAMKPA